MGAVREKKNWRRADRKRGILGLVQDLRKCVSDDGNKDVEQPEIENEETGGEEGKGGVVLCVHETVL